MQHLFVKEEKGVPKMIVHTGALRDWFASDFYIRMSYIKKGSDVLYNKEAPLYECINSSVQLILHEDGAQNVPWGFTLLWSFASLVQC